MQFFVQMQPIHWEGRIVAGELGWTMLRWCQLQSYKLNWPSPCTVVNPIQFDSMVTVMTVWVRYQINGSTILNYFCHQYIELYMYQATIRVLNSMHWASNIRVYDFLIGTNSLCKYEIACLLKKLTVWEVKWSSAFYMGWDVKVDILRIFS